MKPENLFRRLSPNEAPQPEDQHGHYELVDQAIGTADATADDPIVHLSASCLSSAKMRLDELDRRSRALHDQLDQVLEAVDTFVDWTTDRQVSPTALMDAFHTLEPLVRHAPSVSAREGEVDHRQWNELLGPGVIWLREHGIEPDLNRAPRVADRGPEASLGR